MPVSFAASIRAMSYASYTSLGKSTRVHSSLTFPQVRHSSAGAALSISFEALWVFLRCFKSRPSCKAAACSAALRTDSPSCSEGLFGGLFGRTPKHRECPCKCKPKWRGWLDRDPYSSANSVGNSTNCSQCCTITRTFSTYRSNEDGLLNTALAPRL